MERRVQNENHTDELRSALAQLQFLKGSLRQLFAWPLLCLGMGILTWVFAISHSSSEKARVGAQALHDAASLSGSDAEQLARTVEQLDQITFTLAHYWKQGNGRLRLQDQAGRGLCPDVAGFSTASSTGTARRLPACAASRASLISRTGSIFRRTRISW